MLSIGAAMAITALSNQDMNEAPQAHSFVNGKFIEESGLLLLQPNHRNHE